MKNKLFAIATIALGVTAQQASASDGTINFNGEILNQTCTIKVNGTSTPSITITLPTLSKGVLAAAGQTAGQTQFNIQLSGCTGTATTAAAFFEAGATVDPISGLLKNTGTAANVGLELLDGLNNTPILAGQSGQVLGNSRNTITNGNANLAYGVQYKALGATTAGTVVSSVTYSVNYK